MGNGTPDFVIHKSITELHMVTRADEDISFFAPRIQPSKAERIVFSKSTICPQWKHTSDDRMKNWFFWTTKQRLGRNCNGWNLVNNQHRFSMQLGLLTTIMPRDINWKPEDWTFWELFQTDRKIYIKKWLEETSQLVFFCSCLMILCGRGETSNVHPRHLKQVSSNFCGVYL